MENKVRDPVTFVIFGGTGDLTHRKLVPAIYNLAYDNLLNDNFALVIIGRRPYNNETYSNELKKWISEYSRFNLDEEVWNKFKQSIYYYQMDFTNGNEYSNLKLFLEEVDNKHQTNNNHIFYLAVAPEYFELVSENLAKNCLRPSKEHYSRVVIEKPFGKDLTSAVKLNSKIVEAFKEENIYRIDHYLGKEMFQNILVIRFANSVFEPLWSNKYIEQVQISSNETLGVETRGEYYEKAGTIKDMVQSHMLQLLSLIAMEKPKDLSASSIRDEKVKVLKQLKKYSEAEIKDNIVRGQYQGYTDEKNVAKNSTTDTFIAMKLEIDNQRWKGVPFYLRTGKKMPKKSTEIVIQFKLQSDLLYQDMINPNIMVIKIFPQEGIYFEFNSKQIGSKKTIIPVQMDYCHNCIANIHSPEAYERLLYDVMMGDATLFTRWDEVEYSWRFIDSIIDVWRKESPNFPNYIPNTYGPKEADELLLKDNKEWYEV